MKRGTPEHPKTRRLAELLGVSLPCAIGMLELLWHWCARFTPCGDIGKYPDEAIEAAMFWTGPPGFAIKSLKKAGWLEKSCIHRLVVHDWEQHCDQSVRKLLARNHWGFATSMSGHFPDMDILPKPKPKPKPEPEPAAAAALSTIAEGAAPEPEPAAAASGKLADYPTTSRVIAQAFPGTDGAMVERIVTAACRGRPDATDAEIAEALIRTLKRTQRSAALWEKTLPAFFAARASPSQPAVCPECAGYGRVLGPEFAGRPNSAWLDLPDDRTHIDCPRCRGDTLRKPAKAELEELVFAKGAS